MPVTDLRNRRRVGADFMRFTSISESVVKGRDAAIAARVCAGN
jgi:hypothetical protein